jgi:hypothetical protein
MQNRQELQITDKDVINYLSTQIEIDEILATTASGGENSLVLCSKTALAVVQAAAVIIKNDLGSTAAELLMKAFNSQNISH